MLNIGMLCIFESRHFKTENNEIVSVRMRRLRLRLNCAAVFRVPKRGFIPGGKIFGEFVNAAPVGQLRDSGYNLIPICQIGFPVRPLTLF